MPKRVPQQSVVVVRDKASVSPPLGLPFEFTQDEIDQINAANPDALSTEAVVDLAKEEKKPAKTAASAEGL